MSTNAIQLRIAEIAQAHLASEGPLLPILHEVQAEFGYIPDGTSETLAACLNLGKAEVHGTISFYHDFRKAPLRGALLRLCRAEACQAMGADQLASEIQSHFGTDFHGTSRDGSVRLEPVFCLGLCACAPAAEVNGKLVGRATKSKILALLGGRS